MHEEKKLKPCRICRAQPKSQHGEDCLLEGKWDGVATKENVDQLVSILKFMDATPDERLAASLFLQSH